jgi:hypothetical protein
MRSSSSSGVGVGSVADGMLTRSYRQPLMMAVVVNGENRVSGRKEHG